MTFIDAKTMWQRTKEAGLRDFETTRKHVYVKIEQAVDKGCAFVMLTPDDFWCVDMPMYRACWSLFDELQKERYAVTIHEPFDAIEERPFLCVSWSQ